MQTKVQIVLFQMMALSNEMNTIKKEAQFFTCYVIMIYVLTSFKINQGSISLNSANWRFKKENSCYIERKTWWASKAVITTESKFF